MKQKIQAKLKTEILEMIEEMKLQVDESKVSPTAKHELYISFKKAYNQACDDIINQINKG